jgi:hypothetical protein
LITHGKGGQREFEQSRIHAAHLLQAVLKEAFAPASEIALIRNRLTADSPDLFGGIKQEGRV